MRKLSQRSNSSCNQRSPPVRHDDLGGKAVKTNHNEVDVFKHKFH
jgi:hypothetical protein